MEQGMGPDMTVPCGDGFLNIRAGAILTLPTAKAGGFLVLRPLRILRHGLHSLPKRYVSACPAVRYFFVGLRYINKRSPSLRILSAALTSLSWEAPHSGQTHLRTPGFLTSLFLYPQEKHNCDDG